MGIHSDPFQLPVVNHLYITRISRNHTRSSLSWDIPAFFGGDGTAGWLSTQLSSISEIITGGFQQAWAEMMYALCFLSKPPWLSIQYSCILCLSSLLCILLISKIPYPYVPKARADETSPSTACWEIQAGRRIATHPTIGKPAGCEKKLHPKSVLPDSCSVFYVPITLSIKTVPFFCLIMLEHLHEESNKPASGLSHRDSTTLEKHDEAKVPSWLLNSGCLFAPTSAYVGRAVFFNPFRPRVTLTPVCCIRLTFYKSWMLTLKKS